MSTAIENISIAIKGCTVAVSDTIEATVAEVYMGGIARKIPIEEYLRFLETPPDVHVATRKWIKGQMAELDPAL